MISMKLPCFLYLVVVVVMASRQAASTSLTTYWNSHLQGVFMPRSIKDYLPSKGESTSSSSSSHQFVKNNLNISEDVNIIRCHASKRPPKTTKMDSITSLHFLESDLSNNNNRVLLYPRFPNLHSNNGHFLPRTIIEQFPTLKSTNLPSILSRFSITPNSPATGVIKHTVELCEYAANDDNVCVTSLESMVDFVQSTKHGVIRAYSTTIQDKYFKGNNGNLQPFRIVKVKRLSNSRVVNSTVSCHKAQFPFAVFLCHQRVATVAYMVTLEGVRDKMTRIEAATACHMDTSEWDPLFPALVALKVAPGTPVCHFLNQKSVLWVVGEN
ncbi:BURP domain-containing protein 5-like isoform X2 [Spinacia oleracea]|uniref:BURP domain-containing protein 5-like isoform X2 n=1 Tax=Spinacia oleracea TaxID=3562 RepID=A0A9R0IQV4_SPIOL|nr:BURP domain-containing protein 5-like isoform X2 [Spinacia oleracea]